MNKICEQSVYEDGTNLQQEALCVFPKRRSDLLVDAEMDAGGCWAQRRRRSQNGHAEVTSASLVFLFDFVMILSLTFPNALLGLMRQQDLQEETDLVRDVTDGERIRWFLIRKASRVHRPPILTLPSALVG